MRAGDLRHRVTLERKEANRDAYGGELVTWQPVATVWAAVEPLKGREFFSASQDNAEVTGRIRIRYMPGVVPTMRVRFGQRVFDIQAVIDPEERHEELQLMVREMVTDG